VTLPGRNNQSAWDVVPTLVFLTGLSSLYKSHSTTDFLTKSGFGLTREQQKNRELLRQVMLKAGFYPLFHEWWHLNGIKKEARKMYSIIEKMK
jgi:hypothetical protein